jgi:hypothetical protein
MASNLKLNFESWAIHLFCSIHMYVPLGILFTSRSAQYDISANYHKPRLPATTYLVPNNTNFMNNIFKPVIDYLPLDVRVVVVCRYMRTHSIQSAWQPRTKNSKPLVVTNFHCWKKVCPNNLPHLFSSLAVVIVFEVSWYRTGTQAP